MRKARKDLVVKAVLSEDELVDATQDSPDWAPWDDAVVVRGCQREILDTALRAMASSEAPLPLAGYLRIPTPTMHLGPAISLARRDLVPMPLGWSARWGPGEVIDGELVVAGFADDVLVGSVELREVHLPARP